MAWAKCSECEQIANVHPLCGTDPLNGRTCFDERCLECRTALRDTLSRAGWTNLTVPVVR